jgi:hypothetical protein
MPSKANHRPELPRASADSRNFPLRRVHGPSFLIWALAARMDAREGFQNGGPADIHFSQPANRRRRPAWRPLPPSRSATTRHLRWIPRVCLRAHIDVAPSYAIFEERVVEALCTQAAARWIGSTDECLKTVAPHLVRLLPRSLTVIITVDDVLKWEFF